MSLPAWGEWIEISICRPFFWPVYQSLPAWGEWIEIISSTMRSTKIPSLSPHGESGLK